MPYNVAILGATGAVGREILSILEERNFPFKELLLLSSSRSAGTILLYKKKEITVEAVCENSFDNIDIALFSAGGEASKKWAPIAAEAGAIVIDNSSAWRMDKDVPLIVPEVNPGDSISHRGIIANPNCSTIQMVVALYPIHRRYGIKRIVVSTYQAVSGSGNKAIVELDEQLQAIHNDKKPQHNVYPHQIANNCLPHIDIFLENNFTKEEIKMVEETHKIMGDSSIAINATCVRVPVVRGHSESIYIELEEPASAAEIRSLLANEKSIHLLDDPASNIYPTPLLCEKRDSVYVGRIREDLFSPKGISMWVVSDNLRKGAALNAVQIAELLIK